MSVQLRRRSALPPQPGLSFRTGGPLADDQARDEGGGLVWAARALYTPMGEHR